MSPASNTPSVPGCDAECGELVRRRLREMGLDAHVTHVAPLIPSDYEDLAMTCPHGVTWHTEPTGEQIAEFVEKGVA